MNAIPRSPECFHCGEPITSNPQWMPFFDIDGAKMIAQHPECAARSVIGGLNHLKGTCSCCGGPDDPDPPDMTRRQAAIAAVAYWREHGFR